MFREYWPQIRTILISIHLIAITLKAIPAPEGAMNRADWRNPTVQAEFKDFTQKLNRAGLNITQRELEDELWFLSKQYMKIRKGMLRPFRTY